MYKPVAYQGDPQNMAAVVQWMQRELTQLERTFFDLDTVTMVTQNVAPTKPRTGMIALADGSNWNPGHGAGLYIYLDSVWQKLNDDVTPTSVTPTWAADSSNPAIGNGTLSCKVNRSGRFYRAVIKLVAGSTTTFGTGAFYFQLPNPWDAVAVSDAVGSAYRLDSGAAVYAGVSRIASGANRIYIVGWNQANFDGSAIPFTWATNDELWVDIRFPV